MSKGLLFIYSDYNIVGQQIEPPNSMPLQIIEKPIELNRPSRENRALPRDILGLQELVSPSVPIPYLNNTTTAFYPVTVSYTTILNTQWHSRGKPQA
jgi:hypothetical protein